MVVLDKLTPTCVEEAQDLTSLNLCLCRRIHLDACFRPLESVLHVVEILPPEDAPVGGWDVL